MAVSAFKHGTTAPTGASNGYSNHACRCEECKAAHNAYTKRRREQRRAEGVPEGVPHGDYTTYSNWMCRCEACTEAHRVESRARLQRRKERETS